MKSSSARELAEDILSLATQSPMKSIGGCRGTDQSYILEIARRFCWGSP